MPRPPVAANSGKTAAPPPGRPFPPGVSGNPAGRPKRSVAREFFEEKVSDGKTRAENVLEALYQTAVDRKHRDHLRAVELATAYFAGKPIAAVELDLTGTVEVDELRGLTTEKLTDRIQALLAKARARQGLAEGNGSNDGKG